MADVDQAGTHRVSSRGQFRHDGLPSVVESSLKLGRFGRMFRNLPSSVPEPDWLEELAGQMIEGDESGDADELPAGITCFGQFIDHDLTFDPVSSLDRQNDPDALVSFLRTDPTWEPVLPLHAGGQPRDWSTADLLAYAVPADGRHLQRPPQPEPPAPPPDVPSW